MRFDPKTPNAWVAGLQAEILKNLQRTVNGMHLTVLEMAVAKRGEGGP